MLALKRRGMGRLRVTSGLIVKYAQAPTKQIKAAENTVVASRILRPINHTAETSLQADYGLGYFATLTCGEFLKQRGDAL